MLHGREHGLRKRWVHVSRSTAPAKQDDVGRVIILPCLCSREGWRGWISCRLGVDKLEWAERKELLLIFVHLLAC